MNRYVRLDDGTLLDMNDTTILISEVQIDGVSQKAYGSGSNYYMMSDKEFASITHKSDNILDLLRVGDCVEIESSVYLHRVYEQVYKGLDNQVLPYIYMDIHIETQYPLKNVNKEVITAIWFRSGDTMKRVEVKEKI